ncbi:hypothetical protein WDW37_17920 [Bdellovibrionota bacterium FG-1]
MNRNKLVQIFLTLLGSAAFITPGCGGGTGTGNPSDIVLASRAYNTPLAAGRRQPPFFNLLELLALPKSAFATASPITSLQLCLEKMKLEADDGSAIQKDGSDLMQLTIGMVDLGDGTRAATWGKAGLPTGVAIKHLKVVVHKNPAVCGGAQYSMSINGQTVTKDLELQFAYAAVKPLAPGDTITFSLATLVTKLTQAYGAGQFSDAYISDYLDGSFEDGAD